MEKNSSFFLLTAFLTCTPYFHKLFMMPVLYYRKKKHTATGKKRKKTIN